MRSDRKTRLLAWGLLVFWACLLIRAAQVQIVQHERWQREADVVRRDFERIPARRGEIRSSDGQVLAGTVLNLSLGIDPKLALQEGTLDALASALDSLGLVQREPFLREVMARREDRFFWISRDILPETQLAGVLSRFRGLTATTEGKRLYPLGTAGGSVVGLLGRDEAPLGGLESLFDSALKGTDGKRVRVSDASGKGFQGFLVRTVQGPEQGADIETSLHSRLQEIASGRLAAAVAKEGASGGFVVVTRPSTGEILAMTQWPGPDPSDASTLHGATLKVRPVADTYEPGSSFKLVAFAAALEAGMLDLDEPIDCMGGSRPMPGGRPITDHHSYGVLKAWEVMSHSSNIGTGFIAERVGAERFFRMEKALGFGLPTGIQLPGEGRGRIPEPSSPSWSARSLATMAFGQEISCTTIQMAMAYGAVANGGNLMRPLIVRALRDPQGGILERWEPEVVRTVLRPEIAGQLRDLMRRVVVDGTGKKAEIEVFPPGGKTSTAQKYIPEEGAYSSRRYVASFVGFAPWDDPQILCLVLLDEPTSSIYGGNVAAPLFREIVADAIPFLEGEEPSGHEVAVRWTGKEPDPRREVPAVEGLSAALGSRVVRDAGLLPRLLGTGNRVYASVPGAGERVLPGTVVTLQLGGERDPQELAAVSVDGGGANSPDSLSASSGVPREETGTVQGRGSLFPDSLGTPMPDLRGLCLRDALLRIHSLGAEASIQGFGWVTSQFPDAGAAVAAGAPCLVTLGPDSCRAYMEYLESERCTAWAASAGNLLAKAPR